MADQRLIRIATWNIRAARLAPLNEIVEEIRDIRADIVALQEVDHRTARTGFVNQPKEIAAALGFQYAFAASVRVTGGDYGLAVLSRWPLVQVVRHELARPRKGEPRIVLEVVVCAAGRPLRILDHHADTQPASRRANLAAVREIVRARLPDPLIVLGDFNATPDDTDIRGLIDAGLVDAAAGQTTKTAERERIDYLLVAPVMASAIRQPQVWKSQKSDHQALVANMYW